jgi:hypothetical protein
MRKIARALERSRDPAAEMMILATEVADGMAATAALAASRLSDHAAELGDSVTRLAAGTRDYLRARPLLAIAIVAVAAVVLRRAWR